MTKLFASRGIAAIVAAGVLLGLAGAAHAQTIRDHRGQTDRKYTPRPGNGTPIIRDHRKPNFCFGGPFGGFDCYNVPYNPSR